MKKILLSLTASMAILAASNFIEAEAAALPSSERVLVVFKDKVDKKLVEREKGRVNKEFKQLTAVAATVPETAVKDLKNDPKVKSVEKDTVLRINAQTQDWGIQKVKAPSAWQSGVTGKGVKIAVIDTGIASHPDLITAGGTSVVSYTASYRDDNGHGTHVAGIIGAENNTFGVVGAAPEASIYAVKALNAKGEGYLSDIIAGIDWAINNKMDIINLSVGMQSGSPALQAAVNRAYNSRLLIVASAGNDGTAGGTEDSVDYPARYPSVIAAAAINSINQRGSFSATGNSVEVAAPGVNIISIYLNGRYVKMSGTSMAAPYVSGNLALLKEAHPLLANSALRTKLQQSAVDLGLSGRDSFFGYGLIQTPGQTTAAKSVMPKSITKITMSKPVYYAGEKVTILTTVTSNTQKKLANANITVDVISPKGAVTTVRGTTNKYGTFTCHISTARYTTVKGVYSVKSQSAASNYTSGSAETTFLVK